MSYDIQNELNEFSFDGVQKIMIVVHKSRIVYTLWCDLRGVYLFFSFYWTLVKHLFKKNTKTKKSNIIYKYIC